LEKSGKVLIGISVRSVHEEKAVSENLERTAAILRATFESTSYGILVTDLDDNVVNLNRRFGEILQISANILDGADSHAIMRALLRRIKNVSMARSWLEAVSNARDFETIDELALRNGRVLAVHSRPQISQGQIIGRVFTFEDISEQVHAQQELETAREQAERANRAKTEFLRHMSHELRTPLNAIIGFARLSLDPDQAPQREHVEMIANAGEHLLGLINEVLDLAAVEAGRIPLAFITVPAHTITNDCVQLVKPLLEKYQVQMLPMPVVKPLWLRADQTRLRQIVLNLLSNAIKYNKPGGTVSVQFDRDNVNGRIIINDTGIGISSADQKMLFENFSRVGTKQGDVEGTGIGLAFSRKLARLMQGDIVLRSEEQVGSSFCLELPLAPAPEEPAPTIAVNEEQIHRTVLYIEDDALARKLMQAALKKHAQFTLWTAENGATGINMALQQQPDIVLTDMHLGDMTGHDVMKTLRNHPAFVKTPFIMISAGVMKDEVESALQAGFNRYLTKPVQIPQLLATLAQFANKA
jgi:PAS domain S-box-containing protein